MSTLKEEIKQKDDLINSQKIQNQRFQKIVDKTKSNYDQLRKQNEQQRDEINNSKRDISSLNRFLDSA